MIEYITEKDKLKAVIEYWVVDKEGKLDDKGKWIFVNELFINKDQRKKSIIKQFADRIMKRVPHAESCYFERRKYNNRVRGYKKNKWLKLINKEV